MDAAPGLAQETLEAALRVLSRAQRSAWRTRMTGWQVRTLLLVLVVVLGLLQGTRTAIGRVPLASPPAAPDVAAPPAREPDWRRGDFFRPAASTASRPRLRLRPVVWRPAAAASARVARTCTSRPNGSC